MPDVQPEPALPWAANPGEDGGNINLNVAMNADDVAAMTWNLQKNGQPVTAELQDNGGFWILVDTTNNNAQVADVRASQQSGQIIGQLSFSWLSDTTGYTLTGVSY